MGIVNNTCNVVEGMVVIQARCFLYWPFCISCIEDCVLVDQRRICAREYRMVCFCWLMETDCSLKAVGNTEYKVLLSPLLIPRR